MTLTRGHLHHFTNNIFGDNMDHQPDEDRLDMYDDHHYKALPFDPLRITEAMSEGEHWPREVIYHCGEALSSLLRFQHKGGTRDLRKASGLLLRAAELLDGHADYVAPDSGPGRWHSITEEGVE